MSRLTQRAKSKKNTTFSKQKLEPPRKLKPETKVKPTLASTGKTLKKAPTSALRNTASARPPKRQTLAFEGAFDEAFVRHTSRLTVRALNPNDFEVWCDVFRAFDEPKNEWDHGGFEEEDLRKSDFQKMLREQARNQADDRFYHFGIFIKKSGRFIGATALMDISRGVFHNAYLGYWLGNIHWGQGYAREAVQATIDMAFEDLRLHRIEAGIAPKNKKSLKLAKDLGLRREGLSRKRVYSKGQWRDLVLFALTSEDRGTTFEP